MMTSLQCKKLVFKMSTKVKHFLEGTLLFLESILVSSDEKALVGGKFEKSWKISEHKQISFSTKYTISIGCGVGAFFYLLNPF